MTPNFLYGGGDILTVFIQEPSGVRMPHLLNETMPKAGFQVHSAIVLQL